MGARDEQIRGLLRPQSRTLRQAGRADAERYYSPDNLLELDEELFSALGAQLGGENESLRNLLLDANAKIGELDSIKSAVGKLVDPVSKALCAFEAEKSEKISLQTTLNNTRTAYGKLTKSPNWRRKPLFRKRNVKRFARNWPRPKICSAGLRP